MQGNKKVISSKAAQFSLHMRRNFIYTPFGPCPGALTNLQVETTPSPAGANDLPPQPQKGPLPQHRSTQREGAAIAQMNPGNIRDPLPRLYGTR
jgi:hypothetical protein